MAPRIIWRYRRKRPAAAAVNHMQKQERAIGSGDSMAAATAHLLQHQEEETVQSAALQRQEEEEEAAQASFQQQEEEEAAQASFQQQEEEEAAQASFQRQEEEEAMQAILQLQEEEVPARAAPRATTTLHRTSPANARRTAQLGFRGTPGSYPFASRIQAAFGRHDISDIRAFTDTPAAEAGEQLGARAYTSGNRVAFRTTPDLHTAAHEAAHVVQQRRGVTLPGGMGTPGDPYERHADAVADRVVRGESVEKLLDGGPGSESKDG